MRNLILATIVAFVGLFGVANAEPLLYKNTVIQYSDGVTVTWTNKGIVDGIRTYANTARPERTWQFTASGSHVVTVHGRTYSPHNGITPPFEAKHWKAGLSWTHTYSTTHRNVSETRTTRCDITEMSDAMVGAVSIVGVAKIECTDTGKYKEAAAIKTTFRLPPPEYGPWPLEFDQSQAAWTPNEQEFREMYGVSPPPPSARAAWAIKYKVVGFGEPTKVAQN